MTIKRRYLPPMLLAVAAAASIATAPAALAEQSCTYLSGNSTVGQTPGNAQIVNSPPPVQYAPPVSLLRRQRAPLPPWRTSLEPCEHLVSLRDQLWRLAVRRTRLW